ncbi:MAG: LacI family DNA-binding transcriptional regulator [Chloroflexota bacterium]
MATVREVAALAGVSATTVSNVLLGSKAVLADTRERVMAAALELGYTPHGPAQALRTGRSHTLAMCVRFTTNPTTGAVIQGASQRAYEAGYTLSVSVDAGNKDHEQQHLQALTQQRVAALLDYSIHHNPAPYLRLQSTGIPIVFVDGRPEGITADLVAADHRAGTLAAVRHLLRGGRRRIALLTPQTGIGSSLARQEGYLAAYAEQGLVAPSGLVVGDLPDREAGSLATAALLDGPQPPDAIVAGGSPLTLGAFTCLRARGLRMPEEMALVGGGDVGWAPVTEPALSLVEVDGEALGRRVVEVALARLQADFTRLPVREEYLPVRLALRASSGGNGEDARPG